MHQRMPLKERKLVDVLVRRAADSEHLEGQWIGGVDTMAERQAIPSESIVGEVVQRLEALRHLEEELTLSPRNLVEQVVGNRYFEEKRKLFGYAGLDRGWILDEPSFDCISGGLSLQVARQENTDDQHPQRYSYEHRPGN